MADDQSIKRELAVNKVFNTNSKPGEYWHIQEKFIDGRLSIEDLGRSWNVVSVIPATKQAVLVSGRYVEIPQDVVDVAVKANVTQLEQMAPEPK